MTGNDSRGEMATCEKIVKVQSTFGYIEGKRVCGKNATYEINGKNFCTHHARKQRFVIRNGDTGPILARFDTEAEMRNSFPNYPGMRMQKIKPGYRRDIY